MFTLVEGRNVNIGEKVTVYYNITKGGFSIVSNDKNNPDKGKVVAYASDVQIENATFHCNEKKYNKIQELQRKTVYATVKGVLTGVNEIDTTNYIKGYCNPYKHKGFVNWNTKETITAANKVVFYEKYFAYQTN